jgi:hypothetical protein
MYIETQPPFHRWYTEIHKIGDYYYIQENNKIHNNGKKWLKIKENPYWILDKTDFVKV